MAGKNGSTRQSVGVTPSNLLEQPPRELMSERKLYVVRNQNDTEEDDARARQPGTAKRRGMLDRSQQAQLGNLLRAIFSDVAEEPVPERFVKLLEALEAQEKSGE